MVDRSKRNKNQSHWGAKLATIFTTLTIICLCSTGTLMAECPPIIIDMLMGEPIPADMMFEDLSKVRIVYAGEFHTIARHHKVQTEILSKLADMDVKPALGMEMFSLSQQPILDKWRAGSEGLGQLMRDLGPKHWSNLHDYASLLMKAHELKIPIVALNAEDALVKKVARKGMDGLTEDERRQIPSYVQPVNPKLRRLLQTRLRVHKAFKGKALDNIILAQAARDATMAHTITDFLKSPEGKGRMMIVVAGAGHVSYGFGIPERVEKLTGLPYRIILPSESGELVLTEAEKRQAQHVEITHEDLRFIRAPIADYLHVIPLKTSDEPEMPHDHPPLPGSPRMTKSR